MVARPSAWRAALAAGLLLAPGGCFDVTAPVDPSPETTGSGTGSTGASDDVPTGTGPSPTAPTSLDSTGPLPETGSEGSSGDTGPVAVCGDGTLEVGEICWGDVATVEGGGAAESMHGADFDGDGDLDLLIARYTEAQLFRNDGAGGLAVQAPFMTIGSGVGGGELAVAPLDAGDSLDLVATNGGSNIAAVLGDGLGGFGAPIVSMSPGPNAYGLLPGDYTGDGVTDVLVSRGSGGDHYFGVGAGTGAFTFTTQLMLDESGPMVAGDFDGDGNLDALVVQTMAQSLAWLQGNGSDEPLPVSIPIGTSLGYFGEPAVADLDGNGTHDAVFPVGDTDQVAVVLGEPGLGPTASVLLDTVGEPRAAAIADLDHDGTLDVASCGSGLFAALSVWRGDGAGGFGPVEELSITPCASLVLGDLDGDGAEDAAYHAGPAGGLRVLSSQP